MTMSGEKGVGCAAFVSRSVWACLLCFGVEFVNVCAPLNLNSHEPRGLPKISQR